MRQAGDKTGTVTVHVPMKFAMWGGRKSVVSDLAQPIPCPRTESALLKALARAHRWRKQIEDGEFASITELARANGVNDSYACRLLRLTLLSPEIVSAILDGRTPPEFTLDRLSQPLPTAWNEQNAILRLSMP